MSSTLNCLAVELALSFLRIDSPGDVRRREERLILRECQRRFKRVYSFLPPPLLLIASVSCMCQLLQ